MRKIILASHGSMAEGVLSAARMIMGDFIIFCDIHGGSVHNQLTELCRYPNVYLVGGVTLSMILECHLNVQDIGTMELVESAVQSAKNTITVLSHKQAVEQIEKGMEDDILW